MKRITLFLAAMLMSVISVFAESELKATLDFTSNKVWGLPEGSAAGLAAANTYTDGTYSITLQSPAAKYYFNTDGYLMLGKSGATLTLPAFDFKVEKIVVSGTGTASTAVGQNIFVGENAVSTATTGAKDVNNEYAISEDYQDVGTIYVLKVTTAHNTQISKIEIWGSDEGPAGEPTLAETNVTDLSTLGNKKAYALHALTGEGFWCYTPEVSETKVSICGVTDYSYQGSVGKTEWQAPFDPANANHQWQILTLKDKRYIYNLGAKKYLYRNGAVYEFTDTPTPMEFRVNAETETVSGKAELTLGGTFSIRAVGSNNSQYTCICTKNTEDPVKTWTYNDHGGPMLITEIENVSDGTAFEALEELVAQQERTAEWNALLSAASAEYNANSSYTTGDNIITGADWFSTNAVETREGDITKLIDGDCSTFWHSNWSDAVAAHTHYLQVSLPEAIEGLTQMTMGRRINKGQFCANDNPVRMSVEFSADNETYSEPTYFDTPFNQTLENPYVKAVFNVPAGTKYLRFYNEMSNANNMRGYWHCGEFQLNPATLDPTCVNAQNEDAAGAFSSALDAAQAEDAATISNEAIAAFKQELATYHYETHLYTAAELNALESNMKAKVGEVEVVYVNGQYNYIKDETATALLYDQTGAFHLQAGDKVQGLVVVGSPYNGLPEVKPVSEFTDLTVTPNAEYTFAPAEATAVPTAEGVNQIWKYSGVQAKAAATFTTTTASNLTGIWKETDLTFRNAFKHLETAFEEGQFYTIVAATALYNGNVQLYVISAEEEAPKTEVTYTVKFGEETIATHKFNETVGQAPKFQLETPEYVTVSGMPETIEEGTTEITLTTELNEQAPFKMDATYFISLPNEAKEYWLNDNESGKLNELRGTEDGVALEDLGDDSRWAVGGDWLNGFTLQNVKTGNYASAGADHNNGTNVLLGETPEKYQLVKFEQGWRFAVEETFLAHYSSTTHIVCYHNPENYAASYLHFYEYVEPSKYDMLQAMLAEMKQICDDNQVVVTDYDEDGYTVITTVAGKVGYKPFDAVYSVADSYDFETVFITEAGITDEESFNQKYAEYYSENGEFWKELGYDTPLDYEFSTCEAALEDYNEAALVMPEAGKYYTIRNANSFSSEEGADAKFSYYYTVTGEGKLALKSSLEATVEHEEIWKADEVTYSEEETRYSFQNVTNNKYLGHVEGNALDLVDEAGQNASFYLLSKNAENPAYGTLGMQYNNGNNEYRWAVVDMRTPGAFTAGNTMFYDNTYSSFYWFEEAEDFNPETVGVGTVIAPATAERIYNLQGQMQNRMQRGINIRSGKKVITPSGK